MRWRSSGWSWKPGANSGMTTGAISTNSAVSAAHHEADQPEQGGRHAEGLLAVAALEQLGEHRHEARLERPLREQRAQHVRHLVGDRERRHRAGHPERLAAVISRTRPAIRDSPVAAE